MRHDDAYVLDMLLAAREATGFAANLSFDEFERHRMAQLAILKSIEVIGEAASRVSPRAWNLTRKFPGPESSACAIDSCMDTSMSTSSVSGRP